MATPPKIDATVETARRFAALRETFAPSELLTFLRECDRDLSDGVLVRTIAVLQDDCLRPSVDDPMLWSMRTKRRRSVLDDLPKEEMDKFADAESTKLKEAVLGEGEFGQLQESVTATAGQDIGELQTTTRVLESVGGSAESFDRMAELRGRVSQKKTIGLIRERAVVGTHGRQAEIERILRWYETPMTASPVQALYIRGGPGSGKSHLMDRVIVELDDATFASAEDEKPAIVKLDFSESGFEYHTGYGFFSEMSRQVADAIPEAAPQLRILRGRYVNETAEANSLSQTVAKPLEFVMAIADAVKSRKRPLLLILDGIDALQDQGETRTDRVFRHLDLLLDAGVKTMTVLMAGRMAFPASCADRLGDLIELDGLGAEAADEMLIGQEVPDRIRPAIVRLSRGKPHLLRLAIEATRDQTDGALLVLAVDENGNFADRLFETLLSRLPEKLRKIVDAGLFLRRLNGETILQIVAPVAGLDGSALDIEKTMEQLAAVSWLFEQEGSWLRTRGDVRAAFLAGHYEQAPKLAKKINRAAADFFAQSDPDTALYHRLQLTRFGERSPKLKRGEAAAFAPGWLSELPGEARNLVRQAQGRRSDIRYRFLPSDATPERHRVLSDLEIALQACDLREAGLIVSSVPEDTFRYLHGKSLLLAWLWLTGQWANAKELWLEPGIRKARGIPDSSYHLLHRVLLEMRAEFEFEALVESLRRKNTFERAADIHRATPRTGLRGGALDFALLAACDDIADLPETVAMTLASVAPWLPSGDRPAVQFWHDRADRLSSCCGGTDFASRDKNQEEASADRKHFEIFTRLNPYAIPMHHLARSNPDGALAVHLAKLRNTHPKVTALEKTTPSLKKLLAGPAGAVDLLAGLGLTADWSGGFSFFHSDADFSFLAEAAQRWHRAMGGVWTYPCRAPKDWRGAEDIDLGTRFGFESYAGTNDVAKAWRLLEEAHNPDRHPHSRDKVEARIGAHLKHAKKEMSGGSDALSVAAGLQENGVAGAIAVPLSIIANQSKPD